MRRYNRGWKGESTRHSLAAQGVKTCRKSVPIYSGTPLHASGINFLKEMDGQEVWTDAFGDRFGERVCVLVKYPYLVHGGKKFKPTKQESKALWDDLIIQEFGSKEQLRKDLEEEFGKPLTAKGDDSLWHRMWSEDEYNRAMDSMNNPSHRHENAKMRHEDLVKAEKLISKSGLPLRAESGFVSQLKDEGQKYRLKGFTTHEAREMAEADRIRSFRKHVKIVDD